MIRRFPDPSSCKPFAVEGARTSGTKGVVPDAGQKGSDPEWQAL